MYLHYKRTSSERFAFIQTDNVTNKLQNYLHDRNDNFTHEYPKQFNHLSEIDSFCRFMEGYEGSEFLRYRNEKVQFGTVNEKKYE